MILGSGGQPTPVQTPTAPVSTPPTTPVSSPPVSPSSSPPVTLSTGTKNPYPHGQKHLLLDDPLTTSAHWSNKSTGTGTCRIDHAGLHDVITGQFQYHECYSDVSASNFTFQVSFKFGSATGAGIFFRMVRDGTWYNAQFSKNGRAEMSKAVSTVPAPLGTPHDFSPPDLSATHTMAIVAIGSKIVFYVDQKRAITVYDSSFRAGSLGVYAVNAIPDGSTLFRDAKVWVR